jgi:co-chaperonin GroES (HSP10)
VTPPSFEGIPQFHPMPGKIAVRLIEETVLGGLILPGAQSSVMGEVVAVGQDEDDEGEYYAVAVGDIVLFGANSGVKVGIDGIVAGRRQRREVRFFRIAEILCKVTWEKEELPKVEFGGFTENFVEDDLYEKER